MVRSSRVVFCSLFLFSCDDHGGVSTPKDSAAPQETGLDAASVPLGGACPGDTLLGRFTVDSSADYGYATGQAQEYVVPVDVPSEVMSAGECTLWQKENYACDPACGSGAFPMGVLQKMLLIRQKVDPESIEWVMKQLDKIPDRLVRKAFEDKMMDENWDYKYKMSAILHSIYGIDIQPIAVELSKLRFFLTLMVDETVNDIKPNRGINPLPNLSFKFVAANTLIGLPEVEKDEQMDYMDFDNLLDPLMNKLEKLREKFFYASGKEKTEIEKVFKNTQIEIGQFLSEKGSMNKRAVALANWNPFADESSDWFDPKWMFGIKDGFDIVIGNPPYGAKIKNSILQNIKKHIIDTNNLNSAALFIDFGKNKFINNS